MEQKEVLQIKARPHLVFSFVSRMSKRPLLTDLWSGPYAFNSCIYEHVSMMLVMHALNISKTRQSI